MQTEFVGSVSEIIRAVVLFVVNDGLDFLCLFSLFGQVVPVWAEK